MVNYELNDRVTGDKVSDTKETGPVIEAIKRALGNLKFGSIEITVHDGKIVQIERKEKVRLSAAIEKQ